VCLDNGDGPGANAAVGEAAMHYTPNSDKAGFDLSISCYGVDDDGDEHAFTLLYPFENLPDGDVTRTIDESF
jgi:hypothetical protein